MPVPLAVGAVRNAMGERALPNRYELRTSDRNWTISQWEDAVSRSGGKDTKQRNAGGTMIVYFSATDKHPVIAGVQRLRGKNFGVRVVRAI